VSIALSIFLLGELLESKILTKVIDLISIYKYTFFIFILCCVILTLISNYPRTNNIMAAVVVFRNHLINNLQPPAPVVYQIIDVHGYDSVDRLASATDREIWDLISTIRKTPSVGNDASSPKIVLGQTYAIRILHFMYYSRLITKVCRQHTIGPAGQATSTINNIRTIGRYFERIGEHDDSDSPKYPSAFDGMNSRNLLEDIDS